VFSHSNVCISICCCTCSIDTYIHTHIVAAPKTYCLIIEDGAGNIIDHIVKVKGFTISTHDPNSDITPDGIIALARRERASIEVTTDQMRCRNFEVFSVKTKKSLSHQNYNKGVVQDDFSVTAFGYIASA
jgi:hypothetical protein